MSRIERDDITSYEYFLRLLDESGSTNPVRWRDFMDKQVAGEWKLSSSEEVRNWLFHHHGDLDAWRLIYSDDKVRDWRRGHAQQPPGLFSGMAAKASLAIQRLAGFPLVGGRATRKQISRPPGARLNAMAAFFFTKKTYEAVFQPTLRDLQDEYIKALAEDRKWKTRWVWLRGHWSFWAAVLMQGPVSALRLIVKIWTMAG